MPTINSTLSIAKSALLTQQGTMNTTSDNVANVNTEGYARRRADLQSGSTIREANLLFGSGVDIDSITGARDEFLERQLRNALGENGWAETDQNQLQMLEELFGEYGVSALGNAMDGFWNAWHDLSAQPESNYTRTALVEAAQALVDRFKSLDRDITEQTDRVNDEISARVERVNEITRELAEMNRALADPRQNPPELEDRRTVLLDELSSLTGAYYQIEENGTHSVFLDGAALVMGENVLTIGVDHNSDGEASLFIVEAPSRDFDIRNGEIGSLFNVRDDELVEIRERLDDLASTLASGVNDIHRTGYGLDGSTGNSFFNNETTGISDIALSTTILDDVTKIAASSNGQNGNNEIALAIIELENSRTMNGSSNTFNEAYSDLATWLGVRSSNAQIQAESTQLSLDQFNAWRDSVSGVSLDEEMAEMLRYQNAFNAAAKVLTTVDDMMATVIGLV